MHHVLRRIDTTLLLVILGCGAVAACTGGDARPPSDGPSSVEESLHPNSTQAKPLLMGNWPDPTIVKDGDTYYLTHSTFRYRPGMLIWQSTDLRTWTPVTRALTTDQSGSGWAPDLTKHEGRFYLYYTLTDPRSNVVQTAAEIEGPWSEPQPIGVGHIDPGHVVGNDGTRYVHVSGGHVVRMNEAGTEAVTEPKQVYDGWPIPEDWIIECKCLEAPKLLKRNGWYYLTSAQGGTSGPSTSHMVVTARSRSATGPWENAPHNPIIRTWDRDERWWSKGHCTPIQGPNGHWYCIFHGYRNGQRALGRSTLIEPIEWTDEGWYRRAESWPDGWEQSVQVNMPTSDDFTDGELGIQWQFFARHEPDRYAFENGTLVLAGHGDTVGSSRPMTMIPLDTEYEIETEVELLGDATAGLILFGSPGSYVGLSLSPDGTIRRPQKGPLRRYGHTTEPEIGRTTVTLRLVNRKQDVGFFYLDENGDWQNMRPGAEVSTLNENLRPALFVHGEGRARFRYFEYRPLE